MVRFSSIMSSEGRRDLRLRMFNSPSARRIVDCSLVKKGIGLVGGGLYGLGHTEIGLKMLEMAGKLKPGVTEANLKKIIALAKSEEDLREIVDKLPDRIFVQTLGGEYVWANAYARRKLGVPDGTPIMLADILTEDSARYATEQAKLALKGEADANPEFTLKDGKTIVQVRARVIRFGNETCILGVARDVTKQKQMERVIEATHEIDDRIARGAKLEQVLQLIVDKAVEVLPFIGLCSIKMREEISHGVDEGPLVVKAQSKGFPEGYESTKKRELSSDAFQRGNILATNNAQKFGTSAGPDVRSALYGGLWVKLTDAGGEMLDMLGVISMYSRDKDVFTDKELVELTPEDMRKDPRLSLVYFFMSRAASAMRTAKLATTDGLTGLPNFTSFRDNLARRIKSAITRMEPLSILFVDVDWFKYVNEIWGNKPAGDNVLRDVANELATNRRGSDEVSRVGGDEFAWLLVGADEDAAEVVAQRIETKFAQREFYIDAIVLKPHLLAEAKKKGIYLRQEGNKYVIKLTISIGRRTLSLDELVNFDPLNGSEIQFIADIMEREADQDMKKRKEKKKLSNSC
jgi:diguanylate cyclase (GGDEF)-like protein/PAS domain S-box-containing protein